MTIYLANALGHCAGESWTFGIHFDGGISVDIDDALTAWHDSVNLLFTTAGPLTVDLLGYTAVNVGVDDVTVASIDEATDKQITKRIAALALVGDSASATLPPQNTVCVSLRTALATRGGRGRFYLPPLAENGATAGRLKTDTQSTIQGGVGAMLDHMIAALLTPIVWHKGTGLGTNVDRYDVGDVIDTQRRRRNKLVEVRASTTL